MVCTGTGCVAAKGFDLRDELSAELERRGLAGEHLVVSTGCNGFCAAGPIVVSQPDGTFYERVRPADVAETFCRSRLGEEAGPAYGVLPSDAPLRSLLARIGD